MNKSDESEILRVCRTVIPYAEPAPDESWAGNGQWIGFDDHCGCYSEWTQESCSLQVFIRGKGDRAEVEKALESWAHANLKWTGCECCGNALAVSVRIFKPAKGAEK